MAVTLKALNGNKRLLKAYGELMGYLERYEGQSFNAPDAGNPYAIRDSGRPVRASLSVHRGDKKVARLVRVIESV